jgi:hypothetical protein
LDQWIAPYLGFYVYDLYSCFTEVFFHKYLQVLVGELISQSEREIPFGDVWDDIILSDDRSFLLHPTMDSGEIGEGLIAIGVL